MCIWFTHPPMSGGFLRQSERGKERFAEMLDAKVTDVRFGPYGTELVLDGIDPQLLTRYDEAAADCIRAESAMKYFM